MEILNLIAKDHKLWINTCRLFGVQDYPEDLVQEMYIKVSRSKVISEKNYKGYVYMVLRNLCYDKHKQKVHYLQIDPELTEDNIKTDSRLMCLDIQKILHNLPLFERQVLQLNKLEGISLCKIEKETDICRKKMSRTNRKTVEKLRKLLLDA